MSEREEYTPSDEDVEETYVAYEEAFSAEKNPRGNYRRWLTAHDKALRRTWAQEAVEDVIVHDEALEKALREQIAQEIEALMVGPAVSITDPIPWDWKRAGMLDMQKLAARIARGKGSE